MLDSKTGILKFDDPPISIGSDLTRVAILAAAWADDATDWAVSEPSHSWKLSKPFLAGASAFVVILCFEDEKLDSIWMSSSKLGFGGRLLAQWSRAQEMMRVAEHDRWLSACVGSARSFGWGTVWSGYDERAGSSAIEIRYRSKLPAFPG